MQGVVSTDPADLASTGAGSVPYEAWPPPSDCPCAVVTGPAGTTIVVPDHHRTYLQPTSQARITVYETFAWGPSVDTQAAFADAVAAAIADVGFTSTGTVAMSPCLPVRVATTLAKQLSHLVLTDELKRLHIQKDDFALAGIRYAIRLCEAFEATVESELAEGKAEIDLFADARSSAEKMAGQRLTILADLVSGPRTLAGGGEPGSRVLEHGDSVLCDVTIGLDGHWADICTTLSVGLPSAEFRRVYSVVRDALLAAAAMCTPGTPVGEIDHVARRHLAEAGLAFDHHLGHGVGIAAHEPPRIVPGSAEVLQEGTVLCLEPAAYQGTQHGIRLEGIGIVTATGFEWLSRVPSALTK